MQIYNYYGGSGSVIDSLEFDISNDKLTLKYKDKIRQFSIKNDSEFTYKFTKTLVKAADGSEGLKRHFTKTNQVDGLMNGFFFSVLVKAVSQ